MSDFLTTERLGPQQSLTPEGFLIIRAVPLARTGPQLYSDQEIPIRGDARGQIVIDREPDEVFSPATIASLNGKPVTLDHPEDDVSPENYSEYAVGHVINPRRGSNARDNLLYGDLVITDPEAIEAIRSKDVREVSVGYRANYEQTGPGRGRQTNIIANHLALVADGRCGPACRIGDKAYFTKDNGMNNLGRGGKAAFLPGDWGRGRDQGAQGSQGSTGTAYGGTARKAPPPSKPPGSKAGGFTVDEGGHSSTGQQYKHPYTPYNPAIRDEEDGLIEGANKLQQFGEHLQGNDQEEEPEDETGLGQVIALEDPGPGMTYMLQRLEDGSIAVVIVEDDGADMNQNSAMTSHSLGDAANVQWNRRLNAIHRRRWSRTRDADFAENRKTTLFRHHLGPGETIRLEGPNEYNSYDLVVFSRTADLTGPVPPATGNKQQPNPSTMKPAQAWAAAPGKPPNNLDIHELTDPIPPARTGDSRRLSEPQRLASMNAANARFWAKSA
jgi:hypothetical protein